VLLLAACAPGGSAPAGKKTIVVTYSVLGSVVRDLVGDSATVVVPMPNGQDPHEWEPSARDIETIMKADMVVRNGLGLEGGMEKTLEQAQQARVKFFTASDHIQVRKVGPGEGIPTGDPDQAVGAEDPHLWMDPITVKAVILALADQMKTDLALDRTTQASDLAGRLDALSQECTSTLAAVPPANRKLVTGHESLGYFAQRYQFTLLGAIIPSLSSQAEVSAGELADLKAQINANRVKAVFSELGTPRAVADAIGRETGAKVVEMTTHGLPADGSYFTFMRDLSKLVADNLK
jgi:zinc/manganese transport system substrate-binding protein